MRILDVADAIEAEYRRQGLSVGTGVLRHQRGDGNFTTSSKASSPTSRW
jgi:hypothetical protein